MSWTSDFQRKREVGSRSGNCRCSLTVFIHNTRVVTVPGPVLGPFVLLYRRKDLVCALISGRSYTTTSSLIRWPSCLLPTRLPPTVPFEGLSPTTIRPQSFRESLIGPPPILTRYLIKSVSSVAYTHFPKSLPKHKCTETVTWHRRWSDILRSLIVTKEQANTSLSYRIRSLPVWYQIPCLGRTTDENVPDTPSSPKYKNLPTLFLVVFLL